MSSFWPYTLNCDNWSPTDLGTFGIFLTKTIITFVSLISPNFWKENRNTHFYIIFIMIIFISTILWFYPYIYILMEIFKYPIFNFSHSSKCTEIVYKLHSIEIKNSYLGGYYSDMRFIEVYQKKNSWQRSCQGVLFTLVLVPEIYPVVAG